MEAIRILGITVKDRENDAPQVRNIISGYRSSLRASEGLMEVTEDKGGLMMIELKGGTPEMNELESKINKIEGVLLERVSF